MLEIDPNGRIIAFHEKVKNPPTMPGSTDLCLASMGNYIFRKEDLIRELNRDAAVETSKHDFGHDILPRMVADGQDVYVYDFAKNVVPGEEERAKGYWRDVGTIEAYWEAQMDLIAIHPLFNLLQRPLADPYPGVTHDPPAKFVFRGEAHARVGIATDSMVSHGCIISGGRIHRSVLSVGCRVNSFAEIERASSTSACGSAVTPSCAAASSTRTSRSRPASGWASTSRPTASASSSPTTASSSSRSGRSSTTRRMWRLLARRPRLLHGLPFPRLLCALDASASAGACST